MKVSLSSQEVRELTPIFFYVSEPRGAVHATVTDQNRKVFKVWVEKSGDGKYQGHFWLESSGDYRLSLSDGLSAVSYPIRIEDQKFLSFFQEYGLFNLLFIPLFMVIWFFVKRRAKGVHAT